MDKHLVDLGLCVQWLCGPQCDGKSHGRNGHPPDGSGKIPIRSGWQRLGYRSADVLAAEHKPGLNPSILTGWQPSARLSIVVVDCDDAAALAWADANLPATPWAVKTRRGEHRYYRCVGPVAKRSLKGAGLSIDVMADGGQVVAPGAVHRSGHVYEATSLWTAEQAAALPVFDPAWFPAAGSAGNGTHAEPKAPTGGTWPGPRKFSVADYREAAERVILYLERCPVSISGQGGDDTLHQVALKVLRGFPLASMARLATLSEPAPVDALDAQREAVALLAAAWNPRCQDPMGEPDLWPIDRLLYKVAQAASASRLPGPDYWLFDAPEQRAKYAERFGTRSAKKDEAPTEPPADASNGNNDYTSKVTDMPSEDKTQQPAPEVEPIKPGNLRPQATDKKVCSLPRTDDGDSQRLIHRFGNYLRYSELESQWYLWDGRVWRSDTLGAKRCAVLTIRLIDEEANFIEAKGENPALDAMRGEGLIDEAEGPAEHRAYARKAQADAHYRAMLAVAASDDRTRTPHSVFDARPDLLSVTNGTLNLNTGELLPHDPQHMITRLVPVAYDPSAQCPLWEKFVATSMKGNDGMIRYLQRLAGLALTGDVSDEAMVLHHGDGANGKSTFFAVLAKILGEYADYVPPALFLVGADKDSPGLLSAKKKLLGRRLIVANETRAGSVLDDGLIKEVTSKDKITAKGMRENYFSFLPSHHSHMLINTLPGCKAVDGGIWRRLHVIHWSHTVPEAERDHSLSEKLWAERAGILAWALRGLAEYRQIGLSDPPEVKAETAKLRANTDPVEAFFEDTLTGNPRAATLTDAELISAGFVMKVAEPHQLYAAWVKDQGGDERRDVMPIAKFNAVLESKGYRRIRARLQRGAAQERYWVGLRAKTYEEAGIEMPSAEDLARVQALTAQIADAQRRAKAAEILQRANLTADQLRRVEEQAVEIIESQGSQASSACSN